MSKQIEKQAKRIGKYWKRRDRKRLKKELKSCRKLIHHYDKYGCDGETWELYVTITHYIEDLKERLGRKNLAKEIRAAGKQP